MKENYAHNWEAVGTERIPRWPTKIGEKRKITVRISSWKGIAIGAKHVIVEVEEQKNSWWNEAENAWVELSCDAENRGYSMKAEVLTEAEAIKLAISFVEMIAGKKHKNHIVVWNGKGKPSWAT